MSGTGGWDYHHQQVQLILCDHHLKKINKYRASVASPNPNKLLSSNGTSVAGKEQCIQTYTVTQHGSMVAVLPLEKQTGKQKVHKLNQL